MTFSSEEAVRAAEGGDTPHLSLHGVVDLFAASALRELASRQIAQHARVVIECKELERIDASVLQLLLAIERSLRERGGELALQDVPSNVERYLDIAGAGALLARIARPAPTPPEVSNRE